MNIFHVCYMPELSHKAKKRIKDMCITAASYVDSNYDTYDVSNAIDILEDGDNKIFDNDIEYLNKLCVDHKIDYIEF